MNVAQSPPRPFGLTASGMPRNDTTTDLLSPRRGPEIWTGAKMLTPGRGCRPLLGPKNCQVDEEGGGARIKISRRPSAACARQPSTSYRPSSGRGPCLACCRGPPHYKDDLEFESESDQEEDKLKDKKERQSQPPELSVLTRANNGGDGEEERGDGAKDNDYKYLSFDENVNTVSNRHLVADPATKAKGHKTTTPPPQQFVKPGPPIPQRVLDALDICSMGHFQYSFTQEAFACGKVPPLVCSSCQKSGHLREDFPYQPLPELKTLPDMTLSSTKMPNDVCQDVMKACALQSQEEADYQDVLHKLQSLIRESHKDAKLTLYGSSCNGFGLAWCDLDIGLTFNSSKDGKDISHARMIKYLARTFYKHPELDEAIAIPNAKVPIVKLFHVPSGLKDDISLYNRLAQQNTRLLKTHSSIDNRVREPSYTIKRFAKTCDICNASRGSLSNAYILMPLYNLQQREPPVIQCSRTCTQRGRQRQK
ncbi:hypothetical protein HPB48_011940 [Haemaphysalis longicornis]|uniref:Poly(A) RNA polymerase mitochondrial-like central palm domain-containing protein n=1 Tax=Haemaphysalis longicornis TaxID=44386 RepID=A0A9J6GTX1_HAELO|nr:hypothetical protein HPB48_011940 [Haemaphysalis longicornis]